MGFAWFYCVGIIDSKKRSKSIDLVSNSKITAHILFQTIKNKLKTISNILQIVFYFSIRYWALKLLMILNWSDKLTHNIDTKLNFVRIQLSEESLTCACLNDYFFMDARLSVSLLQRQNYHDLKYFSIEIFKRI